MTELATNVNQFLQNNLHATVANIAEEFGIEEDEVITVLDTHLIGDDGTPEEVEPGQGGGWAPAKAAAVEETKRQVVIIDDQIAEREKILKAIPEDGDKNQKDSRKNLEGMIDELKTRKEELETA